MGTDTVSKEARDLQEEQEDLLAAANQVPGVAAALEVFGKLGPVTTMGPETTRLIYAAGGNR